MLYECLKNEVMLKVFRCLGVTPLRNTTINLFTDNIPTSFAERRTVVCCGVPRGGTSMVAGAIHGLGVPMGDETLPNNIEDPVFNPDYERTKSVKFDNSRFLERAQKKIVARNAQHNVWGWKYPRAHLYLNDLISDLINPCLVVVFRDPVPTAMRLPVMTSKAISEKNIELLNRIEVLIRMTQKNIEMIEYLKIPTLMVSYELAILHKERFLSELATFLHQPLPEDLGQLTQFMEPGTYKEPLAI